MTVRERIAVAAAVAGGLEAGRQLSELGITTAAKPFIYPNEPAADATVAVVVPARNEAHQIGRCITALLAQTPAIAAIVLVDDDSTDSTADAARLAAAGDPRLQIVRTRDVRPGWAGKPAACQAGADALARSGIGHDWIVFVDADVRLHPNAIGAVVGRAVRREAEAASLIGSFVGGDVGVKLLLPDIGLSMITGEGSPRKVNNPDHPAAVASGQCFAFRRDVYDAIGGHAAVAGEVLEDSVLAAHVQDAGYTHLLLLGQGLMQVQMYETFGDLWDGIAKNLAGLRGSRRIDIARELWRLLAPTWLPLLAVAIDPAGPGGSLGKRALGLVWHTRMGMRIVSAQNPELAVLAPVSDTLHAALYLTSVRRWKQGTVQWKGRLLSVQAGGPSQARSQRAAEARRSRRFGTRRRVA